MVQLSIQAVNNQNLFSNHYLENSIKNNYEWRSNDHETVFNEIKRIYEDEKLFLEGLNESQLEERFFRRVFKAMLPDFEVQAGTESQDFPDYAFFEDADARDAAHLNKGSRSFYQNAFAIGEVKRWDANLDRLGKGKHDKNMNPSFQIWLYLHETEPEWGILSNGRLWRIYHQDKPMDSYYEVDLVTILEEEDIDAFRYFYYFFRREAFFPSQKGAIFLENVLRGSEDYATEIGEDLKGNIYRAMKILAEGFFRHPANGFDRNDEKARLEVQSTTMRLLYRFLFMLYAEGKGLLSGSAYRESSYSFYSIKNEIKEEEDSGKPILEEGSRYWSMLQDLFGLIDTGKEALGIPAYNGGLFDSERNPNLLKWRIGDRYLADAIDLLSRSEVGNGGGRRGFVDYSALDIRHLGSIYEGLLEYRLRVAETDMVATGGKKREWVSREDFNRNRRQKKNFSDFHVFDRVKKGELYLSTDKGERKATGSYYTPDYIVNYIVKNTIDPVVDERLQKAGERNESLIDATLSVKVLDPAMGSGHFLVGALEHLSARLMKAVKVEAESGRIPDDAKDRYTLEWAKREVASHCIYGVDLNELAVELAKVSLWLKTIAMDKPLSFLDHRLKCGNSLIGAKMRDVGYHPSQIKMKEEIRQQPSFMGRFMKRLVEKIHELEKISDDNIEDIKKKEIIFEEYKDIAKRVTELANLHTAVYFRNEIPPTKLPKEKSSEDVYQDIVWEVLGNESKWRRKTNKVWFREAQQIAEDKSFFHWELEFPEVFFEEGVVKENPGWDCVIGNPPYITVGTDQLIDQKYFNECYDFAVYKTNTYLLLYEKALNDLLAMDRIIGFIIPNSLLSNSFLTPIRQLIYEKYAIVEIIDNAFKVFPHAEMGGTIELFVKKIDVKNVLKNRIKICVTQNPQDFSVIDILGSKVEQGSFTFPPNFQFFTREVRKSFIFQLFKSSPLRLRDVCDLKNGFNPGNVKDFLVIPEWKDNKSKPMVTGRHINRYETNWVGWYVNYDLDLADNLSLEDVKGKDGMPRQRKIDFALRRPEIFEREKILIRKTGDSLICTLDRENFYHDTLIHNAALKDEQFSLHFLITILNSALMTKIYRAISQKEGAVFTKIDLADLGQLPIRRINFTTPPEERTALVKSLKSRYNANEFDKIIQLVEECLPKDTEGNFITEKEKSDIVHDLLAFLAERMIEMNKEKNGEIKGFLEWFEREIGAKIETLANKTKLKQYCDLDFDGLLDILKKNKKKIPVNLSNRELQGNLNDEFERSMGKLKPLIERIEKTDWFIDQVVYRLYGLSEEEMRVVEGDD